MENQIIICESLPALLLLWLSILFQIQKLHKLIKIITIILVKHVITFSTSFTLKPFYLTSEDKTQTKRRHYPLMLAITSLTSGGRSVGIVR
jgi:hypothetical protein